MKTIKYSNELNSIALGELNARELDVFMATCYLVQTETSTTRVFYSKIRNLIQMKNNKNDDIRGMLDSASVKIASMLSTNDNSSFFTIMPVDRKSFNIALNAEYNQLIMLHDSDNSYTKIKLEEFISLKSKHFKCMYCMLSQFRSTGIVAIRYRDYIYRLSVPALYHFKDTRKNIIDPSLLALDKYFRNLHLDEKKSKTKPAPYNTLYFLFDKENGNSNHKQAINTKNHAYTNKKHAKKRNVSSMQIHNNKYDFEELEKKLLDDSNKGLKIISDNSTNSDSTGGI